MNWIKQNTFLSGLVAVTVVLALVLWVIGNGAAGRYEKAKEEYGAALSEVSNFEKLDPYPNQEHLESKKLAVTTYSGQADALQKSFDAFRVGELEEITVQAFSSAVKQANKQTRSGFDASGTEVPEEYFCGFETYRTSLPPGNATSILNYQLEVAKKVMTNLADAGVSKLVSLHRPRLPEEEGKKFEPEKDQVARSMTFEVVFKGREAAARQFLSSLVNDKEHYLVVRSIRIANEKSIPPRKDDARFSGGNTRRPAAGDGGAESAAPNFNALFGGGDGDTPPAPEGAAPAPVPQPAPAAADSSQILIQVLGQEEIQVFVRFDVLLFLEPKELP